MTLCSQGTAGSAYNVFADAPIIGPAPAGVTDDGNYIAGVRWKSRTAGAIGPVHPIDLAAPWHIYAVGALKEMCPSSLRPEKPP